MAKEGSCPMCAGEMSLTRCEDQSDGLKWECRQQVNCKRHKAEVSIRKGRWFEKSKVYLYLYVAQINELVRYTL